MVSPVGSIGERRAARLALTELGFKDDPRTRTSVIELAGDMGYTVTVVHLRETIKVYVMHVQTDGSVGHFGGCRV